MPKKPYSTNVWLQTDSSGIMIGFGKGCLFFDSPEEAMLLVEDLINKIRLAIPPDQTSPGQEQIRTANALIEELERRFEPYFSGREIPIRLKINKKSKTKSSYEECDDQDSPSPQKTRKIDTLILNNERFPDGPSEFIKISVAESSPMNIENR